MSLNGRPYISSSALAEVPPNPVAAEASAASSFDVAYFLCQLIGWGMWAIAGAALSARAGNARYSAALASYALYSAYGFVASHLLRQTIKRYNWLSLPLVSSLPRMIAIAALWVIAMIAGLYLVNIRLLRLFDPGASTAIFLGMVAFNTSLIYAFWLTIYLAVQTSRRRRQAELINLRMELALRDAQYRSLTAQVNPHFLFNSLNSLRALILIDPQKAITAVTHLAGVLRYSLAADSSAANARGSERVVPLLRELEAVDDYLALERIRFEDRLRITRQIDSAALHAPIPRMMLQHLVENAVKHGIAPLSEGGELHIAARILSDVKPDRLEITVRNPGRITATSSGTNTGLINTRQRLTLLYGLATCASCTLEEHGGIVAATLLLPLEPADAANFVQPASSQPPRRPSMRALLVDDERLARLELRRLLAAHPEIEIVGEAANIAEAESQMRTLHPALVFLDIEMPGGNSFELLDRLETARLEANRLNLSEQAAVPAIVFTTAFDRYALKAFEVHAMDYLLKPIAPHRLAEALARIHDAAFATPLPPSPTPPETYLNQFFVRDGELCWMVKSEDLRLIESEGNYARLLFGTNRPLILRSLQSLQQRLDPAIFFRANRTQIVNLKWVKQMELNPDSSLTAILRDSSRVEFSRRQSQAFREQMTL